MTALEICLIIIGIAAIVISYFISEKVAQDRLKEAARKLVLSEESKASLRAQTQDSVEQILDDMSEEIAGKTERELEKLSNEKIMAVHDYSDTVLEEINKNHNEVMFLYSMLDDKDKEIRNTIREVQEAVLAVHRLEAAAQKEKEEPKALEAMGPIQGDRLILPEESDTKIQAEEAEAEEKNNNERILKLHQEGKSNLEIAKELGLGMGEVKLVIDLFREVAP